MAYLLLILLTLILESLPISSSGHMALLGGRLGYLSPAVDRLLHGPFALAIALAFLPSWRKIFLNFFSYKAVLRKLFGFVLVADGITLLGFIFRKSLPPISLWVGFGLTSVALLSLVLLRNTRPPYRTLTLKGSVLLGAVQALSLLPGISRFGSTYVVARWLHIRPDRAIELSFLLHLPLTLGGLLLGVYSGGLAQLPAGAWPVIAVGVAGATALLWLMRLLAQARSLWLFGVYLLVLQLLAFCYGWQLT